MFSLDVEAVTFEVVAVEVVAVEAVAVEAVAVEVVAVEAVAVAAGLTVTPVVTPSEAEFDCAHRCSSSYISSELLVVHHIPKLIQDLH